MNIVNYPNKDAFSMSGRGLSSLITDARHPIMLLTPEGSVLSCNKHMLLLLELSNDALIGNNYFEVCKTHNIKPLFNSVSAVLLESVLLTEKTPSLNTQTLLWQGSWVELANDNKAILVQGVDVSNAVKRGKEMQNSIIDNIPDYHIFVKDKNSVYILCNNAMVRDFDLPSKDAIVGLTDHDLPVPKAQSDKYVADDKAIMESGKPKLKIIEEQTLKDGKTRILETNKVPIKNKKGVVEGILVYYRDITADKEAERERIKMNDQLARQKEAIRELHRGFVHNLITPLSSFSQIFQILENGNVSEEEKKEYMSEGKKAADALMDFVKNDRRVHHDRDEKIWDEDTFFDLLLLLELLKNTYSAKARLKNLSFAITCPNTIPAPLFGKDKRLKSALMNLLDNAIKFTESGSITLEVKEHKVKNANEINLAFIVTDTGIGIPPDKHEVVFEAGQQLHPDYKGAFEAGGSGLGLSLVKDDVEKMGGTLYLSSGDAKGTIFTCNLTFALQNVRDVTNNQDIELELSESLNSSKTIAANNMPQSILLVEDTPLAAKMSTRALEAIKGEILDTAETGEEAVKLAKQNRYDIICMDIGLPCIDGKEATRQIRADKNNASRNSLIIAVTAHADDELECQECKESGVDYILGKPLDEEKTQKILTWWQGNRSASVMKQPIMDKDLWLKRCSNNQLLVDETFHILGETFDEDRATIKQAYKDQNYMTLENRTHSMKGALLYCGLPRLEAAVQALHAAVKSNNLDEIDSCYQNTIAAINEAQKLYENWAKKIPRKEDS